MAAKITGLSSDRVSGNSDVVAVKKRVEGLKLRR